MLCGWLLKACINLQCTSAALWHGRLLNETIYLPIDRQYPVGWFLALAIVTLILARLTFKTQGVIIDFVVIGEIIFIGVHLIARSFILRRFKQVRASLLRHYGV